MGVSGHFVSEKEKRCVVEIMTSLLLGLKNFCDDQTKFSIEKTLRILDEADIKPNRESDELEEAVELFKFNKTNLDFNELVETCKEIRKHSRKK